MDDLSRFYKTVDAEAIDSVEEKNRVINKLKELCLYFDTIIEHSIDGIFISDEKGNTLKINKAYENISGLKREDILGTNLVEFEQNKYISKSATLMAIKKRAPVTIDSLMCRTQKKALVSCNPFFNAENKITMVVSNVRDITELEMLKSREAKANELAEQYQAALLALKDQLLAKSNIIIRDEAMIKILNQAQKVAKVDTTVLLLGETGVGKEEVAKFIHENSLRHNEPFIRVNCAAISGTLLESELFGYEKGAFTGASAMGKMGLFEAANNGTIFLDEIGEIPLDMQVKLLRVLQEREIRRVGSARAVKVNIRIIAATNQDLNAMVSQNKFREDLYYRLSVIPITIPPLRGRPADIIHMIKQFLITFNKDYNAEVTITNDAMNALVAYSWPGNVRELKNTIERLVILNASGIITREDLPFNNHNGADENNIALGEGVDLKNVLRKIEQRYLQKAYEAAGNVRDAAKLLNMKRSTFAIKFKNIK